MNNGHQTGGKYSQYLYLKKDLYPKHIEVLQHNTEIAENPVK